MLSQDEQIALFVDAINKNALKKRREIEKETKRMYSDEAQKLEMGAKRELDRKVAYAENQLMTEQNRKLAQKKSAFRQELYKKRETLTDGVFEKAGESLRAFTLTDEYDGLLEKSIRKIFLYIKKDVVLYARAQDIERVRDAAHRAGAVCAVEEDNSILIGGVRAESGSESKIIDDTLDERLLEEREYFLFRAGKELNV